MNSSLARQYLMRSLAMKRSNQRKNEERVRSHTCILDVEATDAEGNATGEMTPCGGKLGSRGLCDQHRQLFYRHLKELGSDEERLAFEERAVSMGLILPNYEQNRILRKDPFAKAAG